ncbi:hypothetical protein PMAYCL1PPCAC_08502 [Pristionchus mayeri]|uniref:Protein kinase domain-containing protein n=1 Tax=Pristionchus mayeri TaxID=1317129 RepID=A0AAN4ZHV7_9BILA|nr:hypothetical protein PMAYCL1PPCAC_08502 [Pristionchus mayeri]
MASPIQPEYSSKFSNEFQISRILGMGGFGIVFECKNTLDERSYAVKRIAVSRCRQEIRNRLHEVRTMADLDHPGIVQYNGTWLERPPVQWQEKEDYKRLSKLGLDKYEQTMDHDVYIYIQMQKCDSSLTNWLATNGVQSSRNVKKMKSWIKQLVQGVNYIHEKKLIHRDLKPDNILIVGKDILKLCDLGISTARKYRSGEEVSTLRSDMCTRLYMSPEQKSSMPIYSSKTDIFSLGLIFAEMCVIITVERLKIFEGFREGESQSHIFSDSETDELISLISAYNSKAHPTCTDILNHPYLKK